MRYALIRRANMVTGLHLDDPAPVHGGCDQPLACGDQNPASQSTIWVCTRCLSRGMLMLDVASLEPAPARPPTAAERMQRRWDLASPEPYELPDLSHPRKWEPFLKTYFARGVWLMKAHDDRKHTVPDDSFLYLGFDIGVGIPQDGVGLPEVAILDVNSHHPRFLKNTVAVRELDFGVLLLTNDKGEHVRLDARTLSEDEDAVNLAREQHYSTGNPYRGGGH